MAMPLVRVGDVCIGVCSAHRRPKVVVITMISGEPTVITNGLPTGDLSAVGIASCGHPVVVGSCSFKTITAGKGVFRLGDSAIITGGTAVAVSGSADTLGG